MLPNIGWTEWLIIFAILFLLFGSDRMRQVAKSIGRGLGEARRVKEEIEEDIGIGQVRRMKSDMLKEVKDAASSATDMVIDLKPIQKPTSTTETKSNV